MEITNTQNVATTKQFDKDEVQELTSIRAAYERITLSFGQLEMQRREQSKTEVRLADELRALEAQEKVFLDKIVAKYGEGTFDIGTGVFTPKQK